MDAVLSPRAHNAYMREKLARARSASVLADNYREVKAHYRADIVAFAREILGMKLYAYQEEILREFVANHRAAVRGPHGLGKTTMSAVIVLWGVTVFDDRDVKVVTTAGSWRQLIKFLWPEIKKWASKGKWSTLGMKLDHGKELLELSIKFDNREAFPVASDNPALIEGAHASLIIYIFDESKAISNDTFDAAEGAFSTGEAYAFAGSTPGPTSGRFYDIHARKPGLTGWWTRHVTLQECIDAGAINPTWAEDRAKQWGVNSAVYKNRVLGEFDDSGEDNVIPLAWVEQANQRWLDCDGKGQGDPFYGVDVARFGDDKTAIARLVGNVIETLNKYAKESTMETAGRISSRVDKTTPTAIDIIGVGAGVHDRLQELGYMSIGVNVAESAGFTGKGGQEFVNLRAGIWWIMREALDPQGDTLLAIPPSDDLTGDLTAPTYTYTSNGKIKVESKDELRVRIGRSTDDADGVGLALYAKYQGARNGGIHF